MSRSVQLTFIRTLLLFKLDLDALTGTEQQSLYMKLIERFECRWVGEATVEIIVSGVAQEEAEQAIEAIVSGSLG
jgi:hypothetical protein